MPRPKKIVPTSDRITLSRKIVEVGYTLGAYKGTVYYPHEWFDNLDPHQRYRFEFTIEATPIDAAT